jgi:hypothetical protein
MEGMLMQEKPLFRESDFCLQTGLSREEFTSQFACVTSVIAGRRIHGLLATRIQSAHQN